MLLFISIIGYSLSFSLTTNSGKLDDRVLKLAANNLEVFNVNILSLNSVDVNKYNSYWLLYFVRFKCLVWLEWININGYV